MNRPARPCLVRRGNRRCRFPSVVRACLEKLGKTDPLEVIRQRTRTISAANRRRHNHLIATRTRFARKQSP